MTLRKRATPHVKTTVELTIKMYDDLRANNIRLVDALRAGSVLLLAEKGVGSYDFRWNITKKLAKISSLLDKKLREREDD